MSAIDDEILAIFDSLNLTRQGQVLDFLGRCADEQQAELRVGGWAQADVYGDVQARTRGSRVAGLDNPPWLAAPSL
jgi:hypothetical protein